MEKKKEVTIINPVNVAGITLIPVSKVKINFQYSKRGITISGSKQPESIIIISPAGKKAFRITGEEVNPDQLAQENPEVVEKLREIQ